jgi:hypothetical protein
VAEVERANPIPDAGRRTSHDPKRSLPLGPIALGPSSFVPNLANLSTVQVGTNLLGLFVVSNSGVPNLFWVVGQASWNGPATLNPTGGVNKVAVAGASTSAASQGSDLIDAFTLGNVYMLEATYSISANAWSPSVPLLP